jgi:beta-lactamase regulating signal transducer with metallopeptidase domain
MIAHLNDIAQIWWQWMGMFCQVSLLIILISALDTAIRRWAWPQLRYALWGLVFLKLVIPPTWQMPTSIVSWIQPQVEEQMSIQIGTLVWSEKNLEVPVSSELSQNKGKVPVITKQPKVAWQTFALSGWIAGMAIFSLMLIRKMSQFHKSHKIMEMEKPPKWFHKLMFKTAQRLKLKKIPSIIFSKDVKSPAVYGVFRPILLLPEGYLDQLSQEQAEHVLMHELCHLKRGDVLVHWFCMVLQIVYWFNPLLIWTRRQMRYVCEICCDLSVANILREKTRAYRNTLLNTARELFTEKLEPGLGFLGIFEEPFRLVPRLKWLEKKTWENRKLKIISTIFTSLFMVACVMPMSTHSQSGAQKNTPMVQSDNNFVETDDQQISDESDVSRQVVYYEALIMEVDKKKEFYLGVESIDTPPVNQKEGNLSEPPLVPYCAAGIMKEITINGESFENLAVLSGRMQTEPDINIVSLPWFRTPSETTGEVRGDKKGEALILDLGITPEIIGEQRIRQEITMLIQKFNAESKSTLEMHSKTTIITIDEGNTIVMASRENINPTIEENAIEGKKLYFFLRPHIVNMEKSNEDLHDIRYVSINFNDVEITAFIKFISELTGKNFVIDANVKGKVNVLLPRKIPVDNAYELFESVLEVHGFAAVPSGRLIKIVEK